MRVVFRRATLALRKGVRIWGNGSCNATVESALGLNTSLTATPILYNTMSVKTFPGVTSVTLAYLHAMRLSENFFIGDVSAYRVQLFLGVIVQRYSSIVPRINVRNKSSFSQHWPLPFFYKFRFSARVNCHNSMVGQLV